MKNKVQLLSAVALVATMCLFATLEDVKATPSTQIWIPSTDIQGFNTYHLGIDNYIRTQNINGVRGAGMYDLGPEYGFCLSVSFRANLGLIIYQWAMPTMTNILYILT